MYSSNVTNVLKKLFDVHEVNLQVHEEVIEITLSDCDQTPFNMETFLRLSQLFGSQNFNIPAWEVINPGCDTCGSGELHALGPILIRNFCSQEETNRNAEEMAVVMQREENEEMAEQMALEKARAEEAAISRIRNREENEKREALNKQRKQARKAFLVLIDNKVWLSAIYERLLPKYSDVIQKDNKEIAASPFSTIFFNWRRAAITDKTTALAILQATLKANPNRWIKVFD